jgi:hypothetical protein
MIPIHVRFVPKDIWIRLHIDSTSTVGSVKDAVLEKLKMPPFDPTVLPDFYEEARYAMVKPAYQPSEAKAFPKAFMARAPKRNVAEINESDSKRIVGRELWDPVSPSPNKLHARLRGREAAIVAKELIGGDAGEGGMGSLSYVGDSINTNTFQEGDQTRSPATSKLLNSVRGAKSPRLKTSMLSLSAAASPKDAPKDLLFDSTMITVSDALANYPSSSTSSPSTYKLLNSFRGVKNPNQKNSRLSAPVVPRRASIDLLYDPTSEAGLDAYADYLSVKPSAVMLPGNSDAKLEEKEAIILLDTIDTNYTSSSHALIDKMTNDSPKRSKIATHSSDSVSSSINEVTMTNHLEGHVEGPDLELDDSTDDDDSVRSQDKEVATKAVLSSESDSSYVSLMNKSQNHLSRFKQRGRAKVASLIGASASMSDVTTLALMNAATERARGGLHAGSDAPISRSSAQMIRIRSDMSTASLKHAVSMKAGTSSSNSSLSQTMEQDGQHLEGTKAADNVAAADESGAMSKSGSGSSRIAGIHLEEISAWKDASHPLAKCFCVFSYSNGHTLEDWRTVAAFKIRPFELLEIQYSNAQERIHLPRRGGGIGRLDQGNGNTLVHRPSTGSLVEMVGTDQYSAPFCEGWCYIYKRNSASNKAQRAGLGVWKLRYISIRGSRFSVHRRKPTRASYNDAQNTLTWNTDAIKCVFSERADGCTRPALMPIQGLSSDIVTLIFSAEASPQAFVNGETLGWNTTTHVSLSMRFISQLDTCAFFNVFARATLMNMQSNDRRPSRSSTGANEYRKKVVTRATIAGRGGSVLPGRAGREGGRNALARLRLRPTDISRQFDDVDRWSSCSEEEGNDKVTSTKAFKYTDLHRSESNGNIGKMKDAFFDPSYRVASSSKMTSVISQDDMSPRDAMATLTPEDQLASTFNLTPTTRSSVDSSRKPAMLRGSSFAKAARIALSPSGSPNHSPSYPKTSAAAMPARADSLAQESETNRKRRSTLPILAPAEQAAGDTSMENNPSSSTSTSSSDKRDSTPTRLANLINNGRHNRQGSSSPSASVVGRHRSYTLTSPPLPQSTSRRSSGVRKSSTSSSSGGTNFHWPFRSSRTPQVAAAAAESKMIISDDVAVIGDQQKQHSRII